MPRVEVSLTEDQKKAWQDYCHSVDETEAKMLRKMIADATNEISNHSVISKNKLKKESMITIRLTQDDRIKMGKRIAVEKYRTPTQWVRSLIRTALDKEPILPDEAVNALYASNRELAAIGRNLNQLTRALNIAFRESDKLKLDAIKLLSERIDKHNAIVAKLINYNTNPLDEAV